MRDQSILKESNCHAKGLESEFLFFGFELTYYFGLLTAKNLFTFCQSFCYTVALLRVQTCKSRNNRAVLEHLGNRPIRCISILDDLNRSNLANESPEFLHALVILNKLTNVNLCSCDIEKCHSDMVLRFGV